MFDLVPEALRTRSRWSGPALALVVPGFVAASLWAGVGAPVWVSAAAALLVGWAVWIDAESCRLPDLLTLPLFLVAMAHGTLAGREGFIAAVFAAVLGYGVMRLGGLYMDWRLKTRHSMYGDAKFMAGLGGLVGGEAGTALAVLAVILIACLTGLLEGLARAAMGAWRFARGHVVFGPHLAAGFAVVWLAGGDRLVSLWLDLAR